MRNEAAGGTLRRVGLVHLARKSGYRLAERLHVRERCVVVGAVQRVQVHDEVVVAARRPRRPRLDVRQVHAVLLLVQYTQYIIALGRLTPKSERAPVEAVAARAHLERLEHLL